MSSSDEKQEATKAQFAEAAEHKQDEHPEMKLAELLPTQLTVGMRQVDHKEKHLRRLMKNKDPKKLEEFLKERPIPVVIGPGGKAYIIDHHHLGLAMLQAGFETARVEIVDNFSDAKTQDEFWKKMEEKKYVHPYDENGKLKPVDDIPKHLTGLKDDPYRALAGFVREHMGFKKVMTPFAEFLWADYFRKIIPKDVIKDHFKKALRMAVKASRLPGAAHLPGYEGPKTKAAAGGPKAA